MILAALILNQYKATHDSLEGVSWRIHPDIWNESDELLGLPVELTKTHFGIVLSKKKARK